MIPAVPQTRATGFEEPQRWIVQGEKPLLQTPEFFFECEMKRLAAELHPAQKAKIAPPATDNDPPGAEARQIAAADSAEYAEALKSGYLQPPDPEKAKKTNDEVRHDLTGAPPGTAKLGDEFPSEFADYHRGAAGFYGSDQDGAKAAWTALLARPERERHYRTTWAAYMLGKMAIDDKDWDTARTNFKKAREAAKAGFADSTGLAAASLGWEAYTYLSEEKYPEAARLYLEQLATGDSSAVNSLKEVVTAVMGNNADMPELAKDPVLSRLATAAIISGISSILDGNNNDTLSKTWLDCVEHAGVKNVKDAGQLGWIAYQAGDFSLAKRWSKRADPKDPYSLWLLAKLAMRDGKLEEAAKLLVKVVDTIPPDLNLEQRYLTGSELMPVQAAKGELAIIQMGHNDFLSALKLFAETNNDRDAAYLAEAVIPVQDLKGFVDREYPPPPPSKANKPENDTAPADSNESDEARAHNETGNTLRGALARRFIRAGQFKEARTYLPQTQQETLDQYVDVLAKTKENKLSREAKIVALLEAAKFILAKGDVLLDFDDPGTILQRSSGHQLAEAEYPVIALKPVTAKAEYSPPVTVQERALLKKNTSAPLHHYLSLYIAADFAWQAAALMPDNAEQTAITLNTAGSWLKAKDDDAADRFYQAIERRCPKTEIGKQAIKRHWFVPLDDSDVQKENN